MLPTYPRPPLPIRLLHRLLLFRLRLRRYLLRRSLRKLLRLRHLPLPLWQRFRQLPPLSRRSVWEARLSPEHPWHPLPRPHPPHLRFLLFRLHLRSRRHRRSPVFPHCRDRNDVVK